MVKRYRIVLILGTIMFLACPLLFSHVVTVQGRKILVDNKLFLIKGAGYQPVPIGSSVPYPFWNNSTVYTQDFRLMQQMGVNTVKFWASSTDLNYGNMLDSLHSRGLFAILIFYPPDSPGAGGWSLRLNRDNQRTIFINLVNTWKNKDAILMWCIGNEHNYRVGDLSGWYKFVQECASNAHLVDPNHLVTTANGAFYSIRDYNNLVSDLDVWGANYYPGSSFSKVFPVYASASSKPLWFSEFGCDALKFGVPDEAGQARVTKSQWDSIIDNNPQNNGICSGGCIMEWCDEWWKTGNPGTQETGGFSNMSDPRDGIFDEEFWGIIDIYRNRRQVYYTLRDYCYRKINMYCSPGSPVTKGNHTITLWQPTDMASMNLKIIWPDNRQQGIPLSSLADHYSGNLVIVKNTVNGIARLVGSGVSITAENFVITNQLIVDTVPPQAPQNLKVVNQENENYLTWDRAVDNLTSIQGYYIYRSINSRDYIRLNHSLYKDNKYTDNSVLDKNNYSYKITAVDGVGLESELSSEVFLITVKDLFTIVPNYFNYADINEMRMQLILPETRAITLAVYDANGNLVDTIIDNEKKEAGLCQMTWDGLVHGKKLNNGIYYFLLNHDEKKDIYKFVVLKE